MAAGAREVYLPHGTLPTLHAQNGVLQNPEVLDIAELVAQSLPVSA